MIWRRKNFFHLTSSLNVELITNINCTTEEDGDRKTTFKEHTINMPTVYKYAQQFVTSITEVLQRSYNRSTNELKKLGDVCLSFASHLQCMSGRMEKKSLVDAMKKVIAHCLAEVSVLHTLFYSAIHQ